MTKRGGDMAEADAMQAKANREDLLKERKSTWKKKFD